MESSMLVPLRPLFGLTAIGESLPKASKEEILGALADMPEHVQEAFKKTPTEPSDTNKSAAVADVDGLFDDDEEGEGGGSSAPPPTLKP